ncbi:peptidase S24 [Pseudomonas synxantha]|uniref:Peptidase S24 n=1 Tax=Pseudomonas synxantha TaxID=47883 RepID=A0ABS0UHX2_9PSED|nr:S24 family peptidase [Pseudomonas synxantha]MBI6565190.1 peptidase S24 [Pseudomonas synxantha]MBI6579904.1 peptidase S24 [Pseudomonas synxantha]MBI6646684.1 peptidase S24 [Pseudomonas synxantha]
MAVFKTADHIEQHISLDEVLNIRAPHVYLVAITGESMQGIGIFEGDLAVVDRAIEPAHGHVVVALLNNEPVCKRLCKRGREVILLSENPKYPARYVLEGDELSIWGVITSTVRSHV